MWLRNWLSRIRTFVQVRTWRTGILVYLQGSQPEATIGWRTDIDGLPIVEQTGPILLLNTKVACMPGEYFHDYALGLERALEGANSRIICSFISTGPAEEKGSRHACMRTVLWRLAQTQFYGLQPSDLKVGQIKTIHTLFGRDLWSVRSVSAEKGARCFSTWGHGCLWWLLLLYHSGAVSGYAMLIQRGSSGDLWPFPTAGVANNVITDTAFTWNSSRLLTQDMSLLVQKSQDSRRRCRGSLWDGSRSRTCWRGHCTCWEQSSLGRVNWWLFEEKDESSWLISISYDRRLRLSPSKVDGVMFANIDILMPFITPWWWALSERSL